MAEEAISLAEGLRDADPIALRGLRRLRDGVREHAPPLEIAERSSALIDFCIRAGPVAEAPAHAPDLARGQDVYASSCAPCHGVRGDGQAPAASAMKPHPTSFHDSDVMNPLSVFQAYGVVTYGVTGSAMPSFELLSEDDRWSVSFFLFSVRQGPCGGSRPRASLLALSVLSDMDLIARFGEDGLRCLRAAPARVAGRLRGPGRQGWRASGAMR